MVRSSGVSIFEIKSGTSRSGMGNSGCLAICQPNSKSFEVYGLPSCPVRPGRSLYTVIMVFFWVSIFQGAFLHRGKLFGEHGDTFQSYWILSHKTCIDHRHMLGLAPIVIS